MIKNAKSTEYDDEYEYDDDSYFQSFWDESLWLESSASSLFCIIQFSYFYFHCQNNVQYKIIIAEKYNSRL